VNIFLFQFLILGYRRTSAVRPARYEKTGSTRTSPYMLFYVMDLLLFSSIIIVYGRVL
jgi:hypothetical protein